MTTYCIRHTWDGSAVITWCDRTALPYEVMFTSIEEAIAIVLGDERGPPVCSECAYAVIAVLRRAAEEGST